MKKLVFASAIAASFFGANAQKMAAPAPVAPANDGGAEIVNLAVVKSPEVKKLEIPATDTADEAVEKKLVKMGLSFGYDRMRRAIIQQGSAVMKIENPSTDPGFMMAREQLANYAYINAKADIIRAIHSEFSAVDRAVTLAEFGEDPLAKKLAALKGKLDEKRAALQGMLQSVGMVDEAAAAVGAEPMDDRFPELVNALIKKIDEKFAADKANAAALKKKADQLLAEYRAFAAEAEKLPKNPALESESTAKLLSEMPLLGSSVITQAEAWDPAEKTYSVSMAVVWSPKLQDGAVKMCLGEFASSNNKGRYSLQEWVDAQDFSCMVGPRRFTDKDGRNLFIGIAAVDLAGPVVQQNAKRKLADRMALKNVAFSLIGDLKTYSEASQNLNIYADDTKGATAKLYDKVNAEVNLSLQGAMRMAGKTVVNTILGRKIYVSAYYIDPAAAEAAPGFLKKLAQDAKIVEIVRQRQETYARGLAQGLQEIKDLKSGGAAGAAAAVRDLSGVPGPKVPSKPVVVVTPRPVPPKAPVIKTQLPPVNVPPKQVNIDKTDDKDF